MRKKRAPRRAAPPAAAVGPARKCTCVNAECRLRRAGCWGYEACPGFMGRG